MQRLNTIAHSQNFVPCLGAFFFFFQIYNSKYTCTSLLAHWIKQVVHEMHSLLGHSFITLLISIPSYYIKHFIMDKKLYYSLIQCRLLFSICTKRIWISSVYCFKVCRRFLLLFSRDRILLRVKSPENLSVIHSSADQQNVSKVMG